MIYYIRDRLILVSLLTSLLLNIILWVTFASKFGWSAERVPLHFNIIYGIDFLGGARKIYQLPATGFVILLANAALGKLLFAREKLLSNFLNFGALLAQVILFFAAMTLLILNG